MATQENWGDLTILNIKKCLLAKKFPFTKAEKLGKELGVSVTIIDTIKSNSPKNVSGEEPVNYDDEVLIDGIRLTDILQHWLDNDLERSWKKLIDAVERVL